MLKYVLGAFTADVRQVPMPDSLCASIISRKQNVYRSQQILRRVVNKRQMGQCYSLRHSPASITSSSRVQMIMESGENGFRDGIYYSVASRDPTNGRFVIKTTHAPEEKR